MKLQRFTSWPPAPSLEETEAERDARYKTTPEADCGESWWFWCPGCVTHHQYRTKNAKGMREPTWTFNGNLDRPSFTPSLLYFHPEHDETDEKGVKTGRKIPRKTICHLYVTDGVIKFLGDCAHKLAGKDVPLGEVP